MPWFDPDARASEEAQIKTSAILKRLDWRNGGDGEKEDGGEQGDRRPRKEDLKLNQYEHVIASELVSPEDIPVSFEGRTIIIYGGDTECLTL